MYCPNCKVQVPDEAMFCPECGFRLPTVNANTEVGFVPPQQDAGFAENAAMYGAMPPSQEYGESFEDQTADTVAAKKKSPLPLAIGAVAAIVVVIAIIQFTGVLAPKPKMEVIPIDAMQEYLDVVGGDAVSSGHESDNGWKDLTIADSGFSVTSDGYVSCGATVENSNDDYAASNVTVTFTGKDSSGSVVFQKESYITLLLPNQITGVAYVATDDAGRDVDSVECTTSVSDYAWYLLEDFDSKKASELVGVSEAEESVTQMGDYRLIGTVENGLDSVLDYYDIEVIFRDESGSIVGGMSSYGQTAIDGNSSGSFDIESYSVVPAHGTCTLYVAP